MYLVGAPMVVRYTTPTDDGPDSRPWIGIFRPGEDTRLEWKFVPQKGRGELTFTAPGEVGDFEARLFLLPDETRFSRAAFSTEVTPVRGALRLARTKFAAGEAIEVTATLPDGRYYSYPWVGLFRVGSVAEGGAVLADQRMEWKRTDRSSPIGFTAPAWPGRYAFRVFDRDNWFYILDTIEFDVEVAPVPGALSLPKKRYSAGEPMEVTVQLPPNRYYSNAWVGLFQADEAIPEGGAGLERNRLEWKRVGEGGAIPFIAPAWPGTYEFRVFDRDEWNYRLDAIGFEVEVLPVPGALTLAKKTFVAGEPMQVTVQLPPNRYYSNAWVGLFRADEAERRGGSGFERNRLEWKRVNEGGPVDFVAPAWPGDYEFRVFDRDSWHYRLDTIAFKVEVTPVPGALRMTKRQFVVGEPVTVNVTLPPNRYYSSPWVGLYRADELEARGDSGLERNRLDWKRVGEGGDVTFTTPAWPGPYEFRVFDRDQNMYRLDAIGFEAVVSPAPTLRPEKNHYAPGEEIRLLVDIPPNRYISSSWVGLYTTGHAVRGGATVGESRVNYWRVNADNPRLAFPAPQRPGRYELRFYDRDLEQYVLAIAPITVGSPLPGETGRIARLTPLPGGASGSRTATDTPDGDGLPTERPVVPGRDAARDLRDTPPASDRAPATDATQDPARAPTLRFLATSEGGFAPLQSLGAGREFLVEATFAEAPAEDTFPVALDDDQGARRTILVYRTDDPKVFRSGVISIGGGN